ncbi:MAG: RpiB/LacA/LacB family sugar-phosphate isomerase [Acetivibrionales bacterium]|jgi:ribose 5-phosphate isomerase RpiB
MKLAVLTEVSTSAKNIDVINALKEMPHEVYNLGMKGVEGEPTLTTVETGFMSALLLNLGYVDMVIGGCGTGQGYMNSVLQYPKVICGLINDPLNAWLFPQINGGNCVSLALNKDYGWAGDINLKFILTHLFDVAPGGGYPESRREPQKIIRKNQAKVSEATHYPFVDIINRIDPNIVKASLEFPGFLQFLKDNNIEKEPIWDELKKFI